jgi:hypothetical protein
MRRRSSAHHGDGDSVAGRRAAAPGGARSVRGGAGARSRGGGGAHRPRPDLSCQWRRPLRTSRVSPRRRNRRRAGYACARRDLRSPCAQEPWGHRRRGGAGAGARLVSEGGGPRIAGGAATHRPTRAADALSCEQSGRVSRQAGRCWSPATIHNARAGTIALRQAGHRERNRGPRFRTAGSATAGRASSTRRPRNRGWQRLHPHIASRSANGGSSIRSAARGLAGNPSPRREQGTAPDPRAAKQMQPGVCS